MLYLIGLGLGDAKDITVKGLEVVRRCNRVYLEAYTSVLTVGKEALEEFYGRKLILADREEVEQEADDILKDADTSDVAFLVVGDPFGATTHNDLVLRATKLGIPYRVIHSASIMNAVGCCGLQLYRFGETVSIVFWTDTWRPESFMDKVKKNRHSGTHTLCLLDIKVKEQSLENLMKDRVSLYRPWVECRGITRLTATSNLGLRDSLASASRAAGTTGARHNARLFFCCSLAGAGSEPATLGIWGRCPTH
ncbi:diphthine methyl ester synthase-like [Nycticebus coucang]|uniref:diphthine methyl ester synthase-like n=1 Tax=Nycticebus coucang TaxID=9470 RepID=UPI00234C89CD|nr:diphthine methyl ester synthase-like [Nycticebus coucang]